MGNVIDSILAVLQADGRWSTIAESHLSPPDAGAGDGPSCLLFVREDVTDIVAATARAGGIEAIRRDVRDCLVRSPPAFGSTGERHLFNHYQRLVNSPEDDRDRARALAALFAVAIERHALDRDVNRRVRALVTMAASALGPMGDDRPYLTHTVRRTTTADMNALADRAPRADLDSLSPRQVFHALAEMSPRERISLATEVAEWMAHEIIDLADCYPFNSERIRFRPIVAPRDAVSALGIVASMTPHFAVPGRALT